MNRAEAFVNTLKRYYQKKQVGTENLEKHRRYTGQMHQRLAKQPTDLACSIRKTSRNWGTLTPEGIRKWDNKIVVLRGNFRDAKMLFAHDWKWKNQCCRVSKSAKGSTGFPELPAYQPPVILNTSGRLRGLKVQEEYLHNSRGWLNIWQQDSRGKRQQGLFCWRFPRHLTECGTEDFLSRYCTFQSAW